MSFILDALKKSETERQRASGPALFEVKVAAPKAGLPTWAVVVGVLLAVNLLVLAWVLLHRGNAPAEAGAAAPTAATSTLAGNGTPPAAVVSSAATAQTSSAAPATTASALPAMQPRPAAAARTTAARPPEVADSEPVAEPATAEDEQPAVMPGSAEAQAAERERARAQRELQEATERIRQQQSSTGTVRREATVLARTSGLPTRDDLVNSGRARIPELTLSLHAYDPDPARRFVFINGSRAREGDTVAGGVALERITPDGVILASGGQKFVLIVQ